MQCINMNTILTVDKKAIIRYGEDIRNDKNPTAKRLTKRIFDAGNGVWDRGVEEYFHDKKFTFFNTVPSGCNKNEWEQYWLWKMGYYKTNKVPCGTCEICRIEKSRQWAIKAAAERKVWENACFLTLTYAPDDPTFIATNGTINKATMQSFWKKLRYHLYKDTKKALEINLKDELELMQELPEETQLKYMLSNRKPNKKPLRYIQANEYGERKGRCHHHAILFNFVPDDLTQWKKDKRGYWLYRSPKIEKLWGHGHVIIGRATTNAAAYVGRYCTKKHSKTSKFVAAKLLEAQIKGDEDEIKVWKAKKESISASSLGYIGSYYWDTHKDEVKRNMGIIVAWNKGVRLEKIPKPMEKEWEIEDPGIFEEYEMWKEINGKEQWEKILSETDLSEEEYIKSTYEARERKIQKLRREYDEKPLYAVK